MTEPDPLQRLGVTLTPEGGELRVWSGNATSVDLDLFDDTDPDWVVKTEPMQRDGHGVWSAESPLLTPGRRYSIRAAGPDGPQHQFDPKLPLLDPYSRGLTRTKARKYRSVVTDDDFDWGGVGKPNTSPDQTVVYEAHVRGFSKLNDRIPEELRGTYAGLAHEASTSYLRNLGVTAIELLPVHAFLSEQRLIKQGLVNYWGYNTLNFFTPHALYATSTAQKQGASAVLREFKGMVKMLHEAGIEVILDVVYNHTAEEGIGGPTSSLRGLDNAAYYRQTDEGQYIDVTGCGNTVNVSNAAAERLILDSLKYWANEVQIDGFRFDLAATLGRDEKVEYSRNSPLINKALADPELAGVKMIAEPWDVGMGGWQTGNFPDGWHEWNDRYRDRMRDFWLSDIKLARETGSAGSGIGRFATRLAGSSNTFSSERGPLASINFITAHDGFTMADLTRYNQKHNVGNGESNRDGTDNNMSFNHGVEGISTDEQIEATRRRAIRNLMGTLLLSAGIPMITAGDEFGRTQRGNNNAYCHDSELTWMTWNRKEWHTDLWYTTQHLLKLRRENPALRPEKFGVFGENTPSATQMDWYDADGTGMTDDDWNSPENRTLQFLAASTPQREEFNRILMVVHALENDTEVTLPQHEGVDHYVLLWDSADEQAPFSEGPLQKPGERITVSSTSIQLYRAE